MMIQELAKQRKTVNFRIPQSEFTAVSEVMRLGNILKQDFDENGVLLSADIPLATISRLNKYVVK
jgi:GTP-binding protein HflX